MSLKNFRRADECGGRSIARQIGSSRKGGAMSVLLIEPILDRYVAQAEKRKKEWQPNEVLELLLKLRKEVLDCLS
jgi:hypothetical protein